MELIKVGQETKQSLKEKVEAIELNKASAVTLLTFINILNKKKKEIVEFLKVNYPRHDEIAVGTLKIKRVQSQRTIYTNDRIRELEEEIKEERERIKNGEADGEEIITPITSYRI